MMGYDGLLWVPARTPRVGRWPTHLHMEGPHHMLVFAGPGPHPFIPLCLARRFLKVRWPLLHDTFVEARL